MPSIPQRKGQPQQNLCFFFTDIFSMNKPEKTFLNESMKMQHIFFKLPVQYSKCDIRKSDTFV